MGDERKWQRTFKGRALSDNERGREEEVAKPLNSNEDKEKFGRKGAKRWANIGKPAREFSQGSEEGHNNEIE